ncbi:MAG: orotidine-5'-phosphate decarboxylase [Ferruginibacter sp.]
MNRQQLIQQINSKQSFLCIGLDTDLEKVPEYFRSRPNGLVEFNKQIIDATKDYCVSYKINTAFYEVLGARGWDALEETCDYIPDTHLKIADAKRADIGNTSGYYAKAFFERLKFDAVTVVPYMGEDSIAPFLSYKDKWTIVLGLTSNKGAYDFEMQKLDNGRYLYEQVLETISTWGSPDQLMFVVGATQATELENIRKIIPDHFLLVPGVGAQGGNLTDVANYGMNKDCGLLVNASRAIIYAGEGTNFAEKAAEVARSYQEEMKTCMIV